MHNSNEQVLFALKFAAQLLFVIEFLLDKNLMRSSIILKFLSEFE
jgi:hypothetical protein